MSYDFDLSADVVLVHGPNGSGKTSLFDSILWGLTGSVERIGSDAAVVSQYAEFGEARVDVRLESTGGESVRVVRRFQNGAKTSSLVLDVGDEHITGTNAEGRLMSLLWPDSASSSDPASSLSRSLTRAVYLQQDRVRSFIEDEDENSRFDIVGEIVGTGRVGELVRQLELGRKAWTTATNRERERSLEPLERRRAQLQAAIDAARGASTSDEMLDATWSSWVAKVAAFLGPQTAQNNQHHHQRAQQLTESLDLLQSVGQQCEFDLGRLRRLVQLARQVPGPIEGRAEAQERVDAANNVLAEREVELQLANERAAAVRQQMVELTEARESLAALAGLALSHLEGNCPVCGQPQEEEVTATRLHELIASSSRPIELPSSGVAEAAEALRGAEGALAEARGDLARLDRLEVDRSTLLEEVGRNAELLRLTGPLTEVVDECERQVGLLQERAEQASILRRDGEVLAASLARVAESERASELEAELPSLDAEIASLEHRFKHRAAAGEDAKGLHEALRDLSENLVASELEIIEPLLQRIYASVDPHPSFRAVRFLTDTVRGRGRLRTSLQDQTHSLTDVDPAMVLSSSQLNVLAVVTFMAMNLSATALPLELAALDDPLQSLDNVNLLGLADLLRRARNERQLMISTHDDRLAGLLERKLRPVGSLQRTTVLHFDGWEPRGPAVTVRDVAPDDAVPRLRAVG